jgi:aryl sulfotransferase
MSGIVWLASYPKSGNTWVRALLANYLSGSDAAVDINELEIGLGMSFRPVFDELMGVESSDLTRTEIDRGLPLVYAALAARERRRPFFLKVHDAWRVNDLGHPVFPREATAAVIYVVRDPRDVAVSLAFHAGMSIEAAIDAMNNGPRDLFHSPGSLSESFPQYLGTWSGHASSWLDDAPCSPHVVRYEDLSEAPGVTLRGVLEAVGIPVVESRVQHAVRCARFDLLREQERQKGFRERPLSSDAFFRQGQAGTWSSSLTASQASRLWGAHAHVMTRFGYAA